MNILRKIIITTLILYANSLFAVTELISSLSTNYSIFGDTVTLSVSIKSSDSHTRFKLPELTTIPAFTQSFISLQNSADIKHIGKTTIFSWQIKPITTGIIEIPPLPFKNKKSQILYSKPIPLQVKESTTISSYISKSKKQHDLIYLTPKNLTAYISNNETTTLSPQTNHYSTAINIPTNINKSTTATITCNINSPYINQNFNLTLTIKSTIPLGNEIEIDNFPPDTILQRSQFKELPIKYTQLKGKMYEIHQYICQARALTEGTLQLTPIISSSHIIKSSSTAIKIATSPLQIDIKSLPPNNSSNEFSGAVGQFKISSKIYPTNATSSDLIRITTIINGNGYLPKKYLPRVAYAKNFIIYDPKLIKDKKKIRTSEQYLTPLTNISTNITPITFTYFDIKNNRYISCTNNIKISQNGEKY